MDRDEIKDEIEEALSEEGYFLGNYTFAGKDGIKKLVDKCTDYAIENPTADIVAYADTLVSEPLYEIILDCPDPKVPIDNWFSEWLPDNCVSAYFYAGNEEDYTLFETDYPKWIELPYAPYYTYQVPSNIQNQIKEQAIEDLEEINDPDDVIEDDDLCERCIVIKYKTLK
ncbi:MAG: hypothetical protein J6S67_00700 [Methanobrevibacter sp.]|nr:hypothetical protein [Methanobrevibacter sp.]